MPALDQNAQFGGRDLCLRVGGKIGGLDHGPDGDKSAIGFGANHLVKAGLKGLGQRAVAQERDFGPFYKRTEAFMHSSIHADAIAGDKFVHGGGVHINRRILILDKEVFFIRAVVGDRGFEGDRWVLAGLRVSEESRSLQCRDLARRLRPRAQSA